MKTSVRWLLVALTVAPEVGAFAAPSKPVLPFIADDYPKALAQAKARGLPIFIETWAPW